MFFFIGYAKSFFVLYHPPICLPLFHATIEGEITEINYTDRIPWKYQIIIKIKKIFTNNEWREKNFILHLYTRKHPHCCVDDIVHCSLEKIPKPEGDFAWYLLKEGALSTIFLDKPIMHVINHPSFSYKRLIDQKRKSLHKTFSRLIKPIPFALFSSLFLGNKLVGKKELEKEKSFFKFWGISHILARSGLHLLIFLLLWSKILCLFPAPFLLKQCILFIITLIYFLLSWPSIAFNRAFYTFLFYKTATFFDKTSHELHILSAVCLSILLHSPLQIFFLDFQLTFFLTFCLVWIMLTDHARRIFIPQNIDQQK